MRGAKKIIVPILIILILLLIAGGAFAYVYIATDILKTDKEMFFKYFSQITAEEDGFIDSKIKAFNEKKQQTPYENSGEITVAVEYPEDAGISEDVIQKANELSIKFSGKTDSINQRVEQDIEVDYGNEVVFPIKYRQDENEFGLQFDAIGSSKFIAIRNENLDELAEKFSGDNIVSIPSEIEGISDIFQNSQLNFTDEEKNQLQQIYNPVLQEQLTTESFSRENIEQGELYVLELTNDQVKNIIIKLLEATKQNTLVLDKINNQMQEIEPDAETIETDVIDEMITDLNEQDISEIPNLKITLVQNNSKLNQIIIEANEIKMTIDKNSSEDILNYNLNFEIAGTTISEDSENIIPVETTEEEQIYMNFNVQYKGLQDLNTVEENYEIGYEMNSEGQAMKYDYIISSNTQFKNSVSIEQLDSQNSVFLNDYEAEIITNFVTQVGTRLVDANKKQMEELGLTEMENPLIYSNPLTASMFILMNNMNNEVLEEQTNLDDYVIQQHNAKFETYVGDGLNGSDVNAMLKIVYNHNISIGEDGSKVAVTGDTTLTVDATQQPEKVDTGKKYNVEAIYDEEGLITELKVTSSN